MDDLETCAGLLRMRARLRSAALATRLRRLAFCAKANFNPNQPRVPAGSPDGGQWTDAGGGSGGGERLILSDANPDPIIPGAQYAQVQIDIDTSALTGLSTIDKTTRKLTQTLADIVDTIEILPDATPQKYGIIVHTFFAEAVRFGDFPGIGISDVETTFSDVPGALYGSKGSIRTDIVLRNEIGDIIAIYDVKTGGAKLTSRRVQEIRDKTGAGPDVPIIEMHITRGVTRKAATASKFTWIITVRLWLHRRSRLTNEKLERRWHDNRRLPLERTKIG